MNTETLERNGFTAVIRRDYSARPEWSVRITIDCDALKLLKTLPSEAGPLRRERKALITRTFSDSSMVRVDKTIAVFEENAEKEIKKILRSGMTKKIYKEYARKIKILDKQLLPLQKEQQRENAEELADRKEVKARDLRLFNERQFGRVPNEFLKAWAKKEFRELRGEKTQIKDSSSEWGSILIHVVDYDRDRVALGEDSGWYTKEAYLCGIDDNGESWIHSCFEDGKMEFDDEGYPTISDETFQTFPDDIDEAEAVVFGVKEGIGTGDEWVRQGDILFLGEKKVWDDVGEFDENSVYVPRTGHMIEGSLKIKEGYPDRIIVSGEDATIEHDTHNDKTLPAGQWAIYPLPGHSD